MHTLAPGHPHIPQLLQYLLPIRDFLIIINLGIALHEGVHQVPLHIKSVVLLHEFEQCVQNEQIGNFVLGHPGEIRNVVVDGLHLGFHFEGAGGTVLADFKQFYHAGFGVQFRELAG